MKKNTENIKTQNSDYIMHLDELTFWTKEIKSKKIGEQFSYSEDCGKEEITYLAQFVTDGKGKYKVVIQNWSVLLQVALPHSAILADGLICWVARFQVWDCIISMNSVG